ncbi:MAG: hypothetical protein V3V09_01830 [Arenicellales bacterium]
MVVALVLTQSVFAKVSLTPILSLLLFDDDALEAPYHWNGQAQASGAQPNVDEGSINTLSFDTSALPLTIFENLQSIDILLTGECYQIGGETLDPTLYEWSIVSTGSGQCKISLTFTAIVNNKIVTKALAIKIVMDETAAPAPSMASLVAGADISEGDANVSGIFALSAIQKWTAPAPALTNGRPSIPRAASVFPDSHTPSMYEFNAMHNGVALKGVMLTTRKISDPRNISNFDMNARTTVRFVQGTPVLVGSGVVQGMADNPDNTFAFIAVADGVNLPGPNVGAEFHLDGKNKLNVLCADQRLAGFGKFSVKRTGTRIASSLVGFTNKDCSGSGGRFKDTAGVFSDFQVINTHIGKIMRGRGTAHPLHNGRISTVEDMDENDPDYALYMLGVPERLSALHAITPVDVGTEFQNNAFILDPFTLSKIAKIRRNNGTIIFSEPPEQLQGISIGDIIVGKSSARLRHGLLREVTQKGMQNGKFFLQTRPAKLDQLFKEGGITLGRGLALGDIEEEGIPLYEFDPTPVVVGAAVGALREGVKVPALSSAQLSAAARAPYDNNTVSQANLDVLPFPRINFDHVFIDKDNNDNTKNDQVRTEGFFDLDAFITLNFKCHGFFCNNPNFELSFTFEEDFELSGFASGDHSSGLDLKEVLKTKKFAPIWIGVVAITPRISLAVHLNGTSDTTVEWGIDQHFDATLGVELDDGIWSEIANQNDEIIAAPLPDYTSDSGTVDLRARAALEGTVKVMGIKVGGADVGIYTDVEASTPRDPLWEITAGLNSEAFVELDLLVTTVEAGPWELFDIPFPIAGGEAPNQPPKINWIKVDGHLVENGAVHSVPEESENLVGLDGYFASEEIPLHIKVKAFDSEFGYDCCNVEVKSSKDGLIGLLDENDLSANENYIFPITSFSTGLHTITVKVWEKNKAKSTAIVETFTMRGRIDYFAETGCQDIAIEAPADGSNIGPFPAFFAFDVTISGYQQSCFPSGIEVEWMNHTAALGYSPAIITLDYPFASYSGFYSSQTSTTIAARFKNHSGVWKYSNDLEINLFDLDAIEDFSGSFGGPSPSLAQSGLRESNGEVQPPLLAPSAASTKLGLDNWAVGDPVTFDNPFDDGVGGVYDTHYKVHYEEIRWIISDDNATITVNAQGKAQITPSKPGWHKIMVALVDTDTGESIRKSEVFYVAPSLDNTWQGYSQDDLLQRIEAHPGGKIPVDNGEMMSGALTGTNI